MGVCKGGAGLGRPIKLDTHLRLALGVGACVHVCVCQVCVCLHDPVSGHAMFTALATKASFPGHWGCVDMALLC